MHRSGRAVRGPAGAGQPPRARVRPLEAQPQGVADARLAVDLGALRLQARNVAVKRPHAHRQFVGQRLPAHGPAMAAKHLQKLQQTFRA